jgi:hypothetical protein
MGEFFREVLPKRWDRIEELPSKTKNPHRLAWMFLIWFFADEESPLQLVAAASHPINIAREPFKLMVNESAIGKLSHRRDPPDCPEDPWLRPTRVRRIHTLNCPQRNVWLIIHCQDDASF